MRFIDGDIYSHLAQISKVNAMLVSEIVSSYLRKNFVPPNQMVPLISTVANTLASVSSSAVRTGPQTACEPAVPVDQSVTYDYIICLEDGEKFKSLKRHLAVKYDMSPEAYRLKWGLPGDYPMVAPAYTKVRSRLAKTFGLGRARLAP